MVTMYDSVSPSAIPTNADVVAGYADGAYAWKDADWARFPQAVKVRIAVFPRTNDGHVLDVEQGDATPAQAPGWVTMRRTAGIDPIVYCNVSTWPSVRAAFAAANVSPPHYWPAQYDGNPAIPAGAVAKQYNDPPGSGGNYDISSVSQAFLDAVTGGTVALTQDDANLVASTLLDWWITTPSKPTGTTGRQVWDILGDGERLATQLGGVDTDVKTSTGSILAAVAAGVQVTLTAEQAAAIEAQLAKALPGYVVNITPAPAG